MWGRLCTERAFHPRSRFTPTRVGTTLDSSRDCCRVAVHPHACGDDGCSTRREPSANGSPPRVWGRLPPFSESITTTRFTPTRVGTTRRQEGRAVGLAVHPHACGDDPFIEAPLALPRGSPPRVWGRLPLQPFLLDTPRFTPTRVGTTRPGDSEPDRQPGSPPRVWGRLDIVAAAIRAERFTPTRVGTTLPHCARAGASSVHPHACGDDADQRSRGRHADGSPPRVWGRPPLVEPSAFVGRFTPTRVGTTLKGPRVWGRRLFYVAGALDGRFTPTRVGTTHVNGALSADNHGSPPRVWGRQRRGAIGLDQSRFTPTRVGTTASSLYTARSASVHPHACGDDSYNNFRA